VAVDLYDTDSEDYIDRLYKLTVDLTIAFSIGIILYYFVAIYPIMTKLRNSMIDEFHFYKFLPRAETDFRDVPEPNIDSMSSTKELYSM
jgi:hypothetical protein